MDKAWGWLQIEVPRDREGYRLRVTMGTVDLTREQARAGVQRLLDAWPHLASAATAWREDRTTDDYFCNDALSYVAIFSYDQGQDPLDGANRWMTWFVRERAVKYHPKIYADPITVSQGPVPPAALRGIADLLLPAGGRARAVPTPRLRRHPHLDE